LASYEYKDFPYYEVEDENFDEYIKWCKQLFPKNTKKYKRREWEGREFKTDFEEYEFYREEIRRIIHGHNDMCGMMYFWFNYCKIDIRGKGKGYPEFRAADHEFFKLVESCFDGGENQGKGVVCVKRRRAGFSWKAACIALWRCIFFKGQSVGMDSKTDEDSIILFDKVRKLFDRLPDFLRVPTDGALTKEKIVFARKDKETKKLSGNESEVFSKPPTDSAYEGLGMDIWISDEAGKKDNLLTMWGFTEDCLDDEKGRVGVPIIFGTAGDVDKGSSGLKEMWDKSETYDLVKFFMPGWAGKNVDEYGNDLIEVEVSKILKGRHLKLENEATNYFDYVQKQPLVIGDALQYRVIGGIGNIRNIKKQKKELELKPIEPTKGYFRWGDTIKGEPVSVFMPGKDPTVEVEWWVYEHPDELLGAKGYCSGSDPVDHDDTKPEASSQAMYIMARGRGSSPLRIVARSFCKPTNASQFHEQAILAQIYYNRHKNLIEENRNGMIKYYELNGFLGLLKEEPIPKRSLNKKFVPRIGAKKNDYFLREMRRVMLSYTTHYCEYIPDPELLDQLLRWGNENTDAAIAFAWALVHDDDLALLQDKKDQEQRASAWKMGYKRNSQGRIVRMRSS